jgi:hypothetical protein
VPASQADACEFLRRCFGGAPKTTTYYTPVAAPTCCPQQTVSYMPQTCYRTVIQQVPVVAYRPTTACDPCTGCPRTVMSPVTSYVNQTRLVPYTSYRPVVTANYAPACNTGCGAPVVASGCPTGGCGAARTVAYPAMPVTTNYALPAAPAAPACCGASPATSTYSPATTTYSPATTYSAAPAGAVGSTITSLTPAPATTTPSLSPAPFSSSAPETPSTGTPQTFEKPLSDPQPESRVMPPSMQPLELNPSTSLGEPRALDPESSDRITARPLRQAMNVRLVSDTNPVAQYGDDAWQAGSN